MRFDSGFVRSITIDDFVRKAFSSLLNTDGDRSDGLLARLFANAFALNFGFHLHLNRSFDAFLLYFDFNFIRSLNATFIHLLSSCLDFHLHFFRLINHTNLYGIGVLIYSFYEDGAIDGFFLALLGNDRWQQPCMLRTRRGRRSGHSNLTRSYYIGVRDAVPLFDWHSSVTLGSDGTCCTATGVACEPEPATVVKVTSAEPVAVGG